MKIWAYCAEVNWCADHTITVLVKANTQRKAIIKAEEYLYKQGFFAVNMITCDEATNLKVGSLVKLCEI